MTDNRQPRTVSEGVNRARARRVRGLGDMVSTTLPPDAGGTLTINPLTPWSAPATINIPGDPEDSELLSQSLVPQFNEDVFPIGSGNPIDLPSGSTQCTDTNGNPCGWWEILTGNPSTCAGCPWLTTGNKILLGLGLAAGIVLLLTTRR
jgi:hypothetical protein